MKVKQLEIILEALDGFKHPKLLLEQYEATSHLGGIVAVRCINLHFIFVLSHGLVQ